MKKVKFHALDGEQKLDAVNQMFTLNERYLIVPLWVFEDDILEDLEDGYIPDEKFSFYVDEFGEVTVKIG